MTDLPSVGCVQVGEMISAAMMTNDDGVQMSWTSYQRTFFDKGYKTLEDL